MAKKITVASYDIDIGSIEKKISELRAGLKADALGEGLTKKLSKEISQLETQLDKVKNAYPGAGASQRQIDSYNKKMENLRISISSFGKGAIDSFDDSDNYIKKNIKSLQDYVNKVVEADKELKKLKEGQGIPKLNVSTNIGKAEEAEKTMRAAAKKGNRQGVLNAYATYSSFQNAELRNLAKTEGKNSEKYQIALTDREHVHETEKAYIKMAEAVSKADQTLKQAKKEEENAISEARNAQKNAFSETITGANAAEDAVKGCQVQIDQWAQATKEADEASKRFTDIESRIKNLFSAGMAIQTIQRIVRNAMKDFQELDKQFNEIAIVSDYSTQEMWKSFSTVNKVAQEFGVTTKNVLEVQNLYYHQGKDMAEVNKLTAQTLTLAKITGMDYERATSDLTAALNAYNIAAEDSVRVTDTIAAMDTNAAISSEELMTALTKTASIAANAGMSLESTEVFLTKMIETTREAPENLGTALKTIIARFGEVKQEIEGEEIELADINRVDTALKSIGISLLDTAGQIRDLDNVFMELSSKWDDLDRNTQRYIATQAAGSRQQSRFIAMMEDYDRTLELTEIAQDSAGIGARQLAESMDSMETSTNRLKSTWQEFYASLISAGAIKGIIDIANGFLTVLNKLPAPLNLVAAGLMLWGAKVLIVDKGLKALGTAMGQEVAAATGAKTSQELMIASLTDTQIALQLESETLEENTRQLLLNEQARRRLAKENNAKRKIKKVTLKKVEEKYQVIPDSNWNKIKNAWSKGKQSSLGESQNWKELIKSQLGKDGLKNSFTGMKNAFSTKSGIGALAKGKVMGVLTKAMPILTKIAATLPKIITFITQLINPVTVLVAVTAGAFALYRREMGQTLDDTKNIEKLEKAQEKYNNSLKEYNNLQENAKTYEKYRNRKNLSEEELQEQQEAAKALVDEYPSLLNSIDEEGKYHLKNAEEIQKEISAKEELLDVNAKQYAQLRVKNAQEGIYTDENTKAGQAMKNLQDYANSLDKKALKKIAKDVDKISGKNGNLNFNKSRYYDAMEAYASGEKTSFGYKEFSDWFAGDIGKTNWNEFLGLLEGKDIDKLSAKELAEELNKTGAYLSKDIALEAATAFKELNDEMGGILGTLLEGAVEEYSQIDITEASIQVAKGNFKEDVSSEISDAIAKAGVEAAVRDAGGEEKWRKKNEDKRSNAIEEFTGNIVVDFENLSKTDIEGINAAFTSSNVGAMTVSDAKNFDINAETRDEQEAAIGAFWDALPKTIQEQFPKERIGTLTDEVISVLFNLVKNSIGDKNIEEVISGLVSDYQKSQGMYKPKVYTANLEDFLSGEGVTIDQVQAFQSVISKLSDEQIAPYIDTIVSKFNTKIKELNTEQQTKLRNSLINTNFSDVDSVISSMDTFREFGFTAEEVANMVMEASNGIKNVVGLDFASVQKTAETTIEKFSKGIEGMGALLSGTGTFEQMSAYLEHMKSYYGELAKSGDVNARANFVQLASSIQATGKGFKIGAGAADTYGQSLYDTAIASYKVQIGLLKAKLAVAKTNEEMIELESQIAMLQLSSAQFQAQWKQSRHDALVENLTKAKERADKLVESLKNLVNWLREYDRYANLDETISTLEEEYGHLEFEINFSTNIEVIEQGLKSSLDNINTQMFANQGGIKAAKEEQSMWRDTIAQRNSQYVSFDKNGNAIVKAKELERLQREINGASEERKPILQAEYDEIMNNVEAYNKAKDKVEYYTKALEGNFEELEKFLKNNFQAITKIEDKLIQTRMDVEDKELETVKKKYEAIEEENKKYLDSVQKMVDKERQIRDRSRREEDVRDKEKKLAMMKMDTSGVYARDIKALEKELENDYQDLEDEAVDRAIADMEEQFSTQSEIYQREIEFLENTLDYKRKKMTEYNQWAQNLLKQGSDSVMAYLKANDEEYYTGTAAAQANWVLEWENAVAQGEAANNLMATTLKPVMKNLKTCKKNANGFEGAVQQYSNTALEMNPQVANTTSDLVDQYASLAQGVTSVKNEMNLLSNAYDKAAKAARDLKNAQDYVATGSPVDTNAATGGGNTTTNGSIVSNEAAEKSKYYAKLTNDWVVSQAPTEINHENYYYYSKDENGDGLYVKEEDTWINPRGTRVLKAGSKKDLYYLSRGGRKYAQGGFADFTGPAWLDGTKKKPEAVLNALQTKHFIQFTNVLDSIFSEAKMPKTQQAITQAKEAIYNFTIKVDQMASDYDVDKLVDRIQDKMAKDSQYRNVTILKKRN